MSIFTTAATKEHLAIKVIGTVARKFIKTPNVAYNYPALIRLAFNDAMTYNPENGKGGTVFGLSFRDQKLKSYNKPYLNIVENLIWDKENNSDARMDVLSKSDYLQANAIIAIRDTCGPNLCEEHKIGREDATSQEELEGVSEVPQPEDGVTSFRDAFHSKSFDARKLVALASVYNYGEFSYSTHHKFDNSYFKHLVDPNSVKINALDKILTEDPELYEFVELFATENPEFHEAFSDAWLKLYTLGNDDKKLTLEVPDIDY
mmetsp:Transcript_27300/g.24181  ORF Transcript_27300/g.24181 Transcript_27300/m.24181 type:complete len:261 (+) Transcript_27300:26-808(+)